MGPDTQGNGFAKTIYVSKLTFSSKDSLLQR